MVELRLTGPRGDNPLGFLTTLGVVATLEAREIQCQVWWDGLAPVIGWKPPTPTEFSFKPYCTSGQCPSGHRPLASEEVHLISLLDNILRRNRPSKKQQQELRKAEAAMRPWKTKIKEKKDDLKKRGLRGQQRKKVEEQELKPLERELDKAYKQYLVCLAEVSVDPTVSLGDTLDVDSEHWMDFLRRLLDLGWLKKNRRMLDIAVSYGVGDPNKPNEVIETTPWALVRGASQQYFLKSVRELMVECDPCHLAKALFGPWIGTDKKLSLRLDPSEDRRYALMSTDPTAKENEPRTLWGANRLAFEALQFFPVYPSHPVGVVGWRSSERGDWEDGSEVRWPLWSRPLSPAVIRSLIRLPDLWQDPPAASIGRRGDSSLSARAKLQCRGVFAVFRSKRVREDKRYNLTPGTACWMILPRPE